ncbi:MAG: type II toxin-antitoxin system HicB family antitoxin [Candidatus Taylorbacteria bacterium]|nr:type II toxin-antitoxin system HicB family antitoxin [Candidatus Taylorbacteria bacterium]
MKRKIVKIYEFPVIVEKDDKSFYFGYVPSLQGCYTQGKTLSETLENLREAIVLHVEDRIATGEIVPKRKPVSLASLEVAV